jgi:hypothetical protein
MLPTIVAGEAPERRRRPRLTLAYPLRLFRVGYGSRVETKTENISCEGFFCITESFFTPREKLDCELVLTSDDGQPVDEAIVLRCRAEVVRVVRHSQNSMFGLACRVADYTVERKLLEQALALDLMPEPSRKRASTSLR